jgi:hypothetical protein
MCATRADGTVDSTMNPKLVSETAQGTLELLSCPECHAPAEVEWRDVVDSTDGPVEHVKIRCLHGHWFLMPAERLVR